MYKESEATPPNPKYLSRISGHNYSKLHRSQPYVHVRGKEITFCPLTRNTQAMSDCSDTIVRGASHLAVVFSAQKRITNLRYVQVLPTHLRFTPIGR